MVWSRYIHSTNTSPRRSLLHKWQRVAKVISFVCVRQVLPTLGFHETQKAQ